MAAPVGAVLIPLFRQWGGDPATLMLSGVPRAHPPCQYH